MHPTAAILVIGNEILSGRTQDKNINYIAKHLVAKGIKLLEVRIIPDIMHVIIDTIRQLSSNYTYVFTTGGIGPTHDDITSEAMAKAFLVPLIKHQDAVRRLESHYGVDNLTEARLRMAHVPEGAILIENPVSSAPGYRIKNVFVMAGVPDIMQGMFTTIKDQLTVGEIVYSREVSAHVSESGIATQLSKIQDKYPQVEIGSYPFKDDKGYGVSIVLRCSDQSALGIAQKEVELLLNGDLL